MYVALSGGILLISVMSQQYNCPTELYVQIFTFYFSWKCIFPLLFNRYVRAEMNVHTFMNELEQKDYWYPRKKEKEKKSYVQNYKVSGELSSCDITFSGRVVSREGDIHNFAQSLLLNGLSKSAQTFTVGFVKLLSTHPIRIVVWGNFPFNIDKTAE